MITYPIKPELVTITALPRNIKIAPNDVTKEYLAAFLTSKKKAFQTDTQKFSLVRAIWM